MSYRVVERLSEGLVGVESLRYGRQAWVSGVTRKSARCARCRKDIPKGAVAYRTLNGSTMNRHERLCGACVGQ